MGKERHGTKEDQKQAVLTPRVPQLIRQVLDFIRHDSKTLHYKRESCCAVVGFFTPSA